MFERPIADVSEPTAGWADGRDPVELLKGSGFGGVAIRCQMGATRVNVEDGVRFRDRIRRGGLKAAQWVVLDVGDDFGPFDMAEAARVTSAVARHFDGTNVQAELSLQQTGEFLANLNLPTGHPLALETLPTFEMSNVVAGWDRRKAWLRQETYLIENGWTAKMAADWTFKFRAHDGSDLLPGWVGWYIRATINGRSVRGVLESPSSFGALGVSYHLDRTSRRLYKKGTVPRQHVGNLIGLWARDRWAPVLRTTPNGTRELEPAGATSDVLDAGRPLAPVGVYLGETTPLRFWRGYRAP